MRSGPYFQSLTAKETKHRGGDIYIKIKIVQRLVYVEKTLGGIAKKQQRKGSGQAIRPKRGWSLLFVIAYNVCYLL